MRLVTRDVLAYRDRAHREDVWAKFAAEVSPWAFVLGPSWVLGPRSAIEQTSSQRHGLGTKDQARTKHQGQSTKDGGAGRYRRGTNTVTDDIVEFPELSVHSTVIV
jgi:hypothetical protein